MRPDSAGNRSVWGPVLDRECTLRGGADAFNAPCRLCDLRSPPGRAVVAPVPDVDWWLSSAACRGSNTGPWRSVQAGDLGKCPPPPKLTGGGEPARGVVAMFGQTLTSRATSHVGESIPALQRKKTVHVAMRRRTAP